MLKHISLSILIAVTHVYNVHAMLDVEIQSVEKALILGSQVIATPQDSFELICDFVQQNSAELHVQDASTGNTPLHENVIEACWHNKPARLLTIAAMLTCGAQKTIKNNEGLTPLACAQEAALQEGAHPLQQAVAELLTLKKPTKQTLIALVTKYQLKSLEPMLITY